MIEPQLKISCGSREIPLHNYVVYMPSIKYNRGVNARVRSFPSRAKFKAIAITKVIGNKFAVMNAQF